MKGMNDKFQKWYKLALTLLSVTVVVQAGFLYRQSNQYHNGVAVSDAQLEAQQMVIDELDSYLSERDQLLVESGVRAERQFQLLRQYQADLYSFEVEIQRLQVAFFDSQKVVSVKTTMLLEAEKQHKKRINSVIIKERRKANENLARFEKERELLEQKEIELNAKVSEDWTQKRQELEALYANSAREVENEKRVDALMKQFNQLRVDLGVVNECDKDYLYRYNEAKSLLSHIRTFIQKYEMKEEFYYFVISNESSIIQQNRRLCLEN